LPQDPDSWHPQLELARSGDRDSFYSLIEAETAKFRKTIPDRAVAMARYVEQLPSTTLVPVFGSVKLKMSPEQVHAATQEVKWERDEKRTKDGLVRYRTGLNPAFEQAVVAHATLYFVAQELSKGLVGLAVTYGFKSPEEAKEFASLITARYGKHLRPVPYNTAKASGDFLCDLKQKYSIHVVVEYGVQVAIALRDGCPEYYEVATTKDDVARSLLTKTIDSPTELSERQSCIKTFTVETPTEERAYERFCNGSNCSDPVETWVKSWRIDRYVQNVCRINIAVTCAGKRLELWKNDKEGCEGPYSVH